MGADIVACCWLPNGRKKFLRIPNYPRDMAASVLIVLRFNSMFSGKWLQEHEALAAIIFVTLSIALTGFFAWLERRFFRQ
jgi:hypothetical protein